MSSNKFNGDKLFEARKAKKFSQTKLALLVGVSRQTIYLWESNQTTPDVEKVSRICEALEINMKDLFDDTEIFNDTKNNENNVETDNIVENNANTEINEYNNFDNSDIIELNNNSDINIEDDTDIIIANDFNNKNIFKKIIIFLLLILFSIYVIISILKFIRLNKILNEWEELDKIDNYYIEIEEYLVNEKDEDIILENYFYEKYYHNGVLKTIMKDRKDDKIQSIIICDYNKMKKYIIYEESKTYLVKKIDKSDIKALSSNYYFSNSNTNNNFMNFANCFLLTFDVKKQDKYKIIFKDKYKEVINKNNYLLEYEENLNQNFRKNKRYYKIELNSKKDFEINLDEYTEIE